MLYLLSTLLLVNFAWSQGSSPVIKYDENKITICAITLNSTDEREVFRSQIAKEPKKYNPLIELTNLGENDDWFKNACASNIKCDQLVISGHFTGEFYGEEDDSKTLSIQELEKAGCSKTCEGILNNPVEVFLFGCNTLAEKGDPQLQTSYIERLVAHGRTRQDAEIAAEARYGQLGQSFKSSMQRSFGHLKKNIYGFDDVGPSGANVKNKLINYFKGFRQPHEPVTSKKPITHTQHLDVLQTKRLTSQLQETNESLEKINPPKANDNFDANKRLQFNLANTAFAQCHQANFKDIKTQRICSLLQDKTSVDEKIKVVYDMLLEEDYRHYLPSINEFYKDLYSKTLTDENRKSLLMISQNEVIKRQILNVVNETQSLNQKQTWSKFAVNMDFMTEQQRDKILSNQIVKYFENPISDDLVAVLCESNADTISKEAIERVSNLDLSRFRGNEIQVLSCLQIHSDILDKKIDKLFFSTTNVETKKEILEYLVWPGTPSDKVISQTLSLISQPVLTSTVIEFCMVRKCPGIQSKMASLLFSSIGNPQKVELLLDVLSGFTSFSTQDKTVLASIYKLASKGTHRETASMAAGAFVSSMQDIIEKIEESPTQKDLPVLNRAEAELKEIMKNKYIQDYVGMDLENALGNIQQLKKDIAKPK